MLTDKDLEELRQERHDDYVAEARRELEAAWDGVPRLEARLKSLQKSADRCSKPLQAAELDQGVVLPRGAQGGVVGYICHQAQTTGSAGLNFCDAGDELLIVYAAAWVDLGLGCAQALFPWDSRMAKDCDVGIRNVSHFGSPANMRGRGWPLLCGASLAPVSLEVA